MANEGDYVALGLTCADICTAIKEGMDGKKESDLNEPIRKAIERLERWVKSEICVSHNSLSTLPVPGLLWRSSWRSSRRQKAVTN